MTDNMNTLEESQILSRLEKLIPEKIEFLNPVIDRHDRQILRSLLSPDQLYEWRTGKRYRSMALPISRRNFIRDVVPLFVLMLPLGGIVYWRAGDLRMTGIILAAYLLVILTGIRTRFRRLRKMSQFPIVMIRGSNLIFRKKTGNFFFQQPDGRRILNLDEIECLISVTSPFVEVNGKPWIFSFRNWHILYAVRWDSTLECLIIAHGRMLSCFRYFYRSLAKLTGKKLYEFQRGSEAGLFGKNSHDHLFMGPGL